MLKLIKELNHSDIDMRIFTYALGDDVSIDLLKKIACANKGIF